MRDLLLLDARVRTMDPDRPLAEAVALRGERVLAVGTAAELRARLAPGAREVGLGGATVLPGLHDAHVHLSQHGLELAQLPLQETGSVAEAVALVRERAASTPPGTWIFGAGFALQRYGVSTLDREELDAAAPEHPVLLRSQDHHSAWANGRALEMAGIHRGTPDPEGGTIVRRPDGEPSGLLLEHAFDLVRERTPPLTRAEAVAALERAGRDLARYGITTVHHMAYEPVDQWRAIGLRATDAGYPLRVWACIDQHLIECAADLGVATGQGGEHFLVGGAKFFVDGALGSRTAWMLEPYDDGAGTGVQVHGPDLLRERVPLAIRAGLTPVAHAIGDAACRAVLDVYEATAPAWRGAGLRPRLEHAQHLHRDDVRRLAELGVVVSMQPLHLVFDVPSIRGLLAGRAERAYRWGSLLAAGAPLAFGSDTPVASPDPFAGLRAACRREGVGGDVLGPEEALSVEAALAAYTRGAAYAIGREERSGVLRPGADADLVVLDHDPVASLDDLEVLATVKGGRVTHGTL